MCAYFAFNYSRDVEEALSLGIETIQISKKLLKATPDAEKVKYCYECSACTASCPVAWMFPKHYNPKILLQKVFLDSREVLNEAGLWMCARCYRCYRRCPQGINLPEIFSATRDLAVELGYTSHAENKLWEALKLIKEETPLAAVNTWLCLRPPEEGFKHSEVEKLVTKVLKNFVDDYKKEKILPTPKTRKEKIAVVGSGPAGLTVAYSLVKMGYPVTIFESLPETGGMMRVGIPEFRLPRNVLDVEVHRLNKLGVEIKTGITVGEDLTIDDLFRNGYDATFIAIGAHKSRELRIEGEEPETITNAVDLLRAINTGKSVKLGEKVAVIGGGNVAVDVARTALRQGTKDVNILYRRSREEMPANPLEIKEAEKEGVKIHFLLAPKRISGRDGHAVVLEFARMKLGELDDSGRRRPIPVVGSEFIMQFDAVIPAIGELPDVSFLPDEIEVARGNIVKVNPLTLETTMPGVFAGGDAVSGPATVIEAIAAGKRAASSIHRYLGGKDSS